MSSSRWQCSQRYVRTGENQSDLVKASRTQKIVSHVSHVFAPKRTKRLQTVYHLMRAMFTFLFSLAWLFEQTNMSLIVLLQQQNALLVSYKSFKQRLGQELDIMFKN